MLDVATLREALAKKLLTPSSRRMVVTWAIDEKGYSERRTHFHKTGLRSYTLWRWTRTRAVTVSG